MQHHRRTRRPAFIRRNDKNWLTQKDRQSFLSEAEQIHQYYLASLQYDTDGNPIPKELWPEEAIPKPRKKQKTSKRRYRPDLRFLEF